MRTAAPGTVLLLLGCLFVTGCQTARPQRVDPASQNGLRADTSAVHALRVRLEALELRQQFTEALAQESLGNYSRALELYTDLVERRPNGGSRDPLRTRALLRMARIHRNQMNNVSRAARLYERVLADPGGEVPAESIYLELAGLYREAGRDSEALGTYERLLAEHPTSNVAPEALYNIGMIYFHQERFTPAVQNFQRLLDRFPRADLADGALFRTAEVYEKTDQPGKELQAYETLLEQYPESDLREFAMYQAARLSHRLGRIQQAKQWIQEYRNEFPQGEYIDQLPGVS